MKVTQALIIFALFSVIKTDLEGFDVNNCADFEPDGQPAYSLDFCRATYFDTSKVARCCFMKFKESNGITQYHCLELDLNEFMDIDTVIDAIELSGYDVSSLDCSSSYLYFPLLLILAFIL